MRQLALTTLGLIALGTGCTQSPPPDLRRAAAPPTVEAQPARALAAPSAPVLTRVDPTLVCMVNNQFMGKPQIPVLVNGNTYYGCCEMCKGRLEQDRTARFSTDPVSGQPVDKATAVIGRDASNRVLYFENEATYRQYPGT